MPAISASAILPSAVANGSSVTIPWPAGVNPADAALSTGDNVLVNDNDAYKAPNVLIAVASSGIRVTNLTGASWPADASLRADVGSKKGADVNINPFDFTAIDLSGAGDALQPSMANTKVASWSPPGGNTTVPAVFGINAFTALGTATGRSVAATNRATRMRRLGYVSATLAGSLAGIYQGANGTLWSIGTGSGDGGFHLGWRFIVSDPATVDGARMLVGLRAGGAAPTNVEPDSLQNIIGVAQLSTSNNLQIVYGGSSAQPDIDLGPEFAVAAGSVEAFDVTLVAQPNRQDVFYRVTKLSNGAFVSGILPGDAGAGVTLPSPSTFLNPVAWRSNNAQALAVGLDIVNLYIKTNY